MGKLLLVRAVADDGQVFADVVERDPEGRIWRIKNGKGSFVVRRTTSGRPVRLDVDPQETHRQWEQLRRERPEDHDDLETLLIGARWYFDS